jgi:hypothetical protein
MGHVFSAHPKNSGCGCLVNVLPSGERANETRVISEMGNAPEFDLVVVSNEK